MSRLPVISAIPELARSWQGRVILVVVAVQCLLPLHYYVARRDPHDERFAWRMFSPMREARCSARWTLDGKPLVITNQFHEAWLELEQRGRFAVIEAMAADQCAKHPGGKVSVTLDCSYLEQPSRSWGGHDMCTDPEL